MQPSYDSLRTLENIFEVKFGGPEEDSMWNVVNYVYVASTPLGTWAGMTELCKDGRGSVTAVAAQESLCTIFPSWTTRGDTLRRAFLR